MSIDLKYTAEDLAQARLEAAAPDLLAALQDILKHGGTSDDEWVPQWCIDNARAAIRRATEVQGA